MYIECITHNSNMYILPHCLAPCSVQMGQDLIKHHQITPQRAPPPYYFTKGKIKCQSHPP